MLINFDSLISLVSWLMASQFSHCNKICCGGYKSKQRKYTSKINVISYDLLNHIILTADCNSPGMTAIPQFGNNLMKSKFCDTDIIFFLGKCALICMKQ
jgi:hypothetical protein